MATDNKTSSGVQELIDRLQKEGVEKGEVEATAVLADARRQGMEIVDQARAEATGITRDARQEAERTIAGGQEAVRLAGRDTILQLTEELRGDFEGKLRRLIAFRLDDTEFLERLILEVARRALPEDTGANVDLLVSPDLVSAEELSKSVDEVEPGTLSHFILSLAGETLRDGLTFRVADETIPGVRVQIVDEDLEIDLTADTLTHLLRKHLSPRFRALIES